MQTVGPSTNSNLVLPKSTRVFWETVYKVEMRHDHIYRVLVIGTGDGKISQRVVIQEHRKLPPDDNNQLAYTKMKLLSSLHLRILTIGRAHTPRFAFSCTNLKQAIIPL